MKVVLGPIGELSPAQLARWTAIQDSVPVLDSPCFAPEFFRSIADVRTGVEVALLDGPGGQLGFFPFERGRRNVGHPVGREFSDFQAVVAEPGLHWSGLELLRGSRLSAWRFDHLIATQEQFQPFHFGEAPSPFVDLSQGFEGFRAERKRLGSKEIDKILYEARKAERRKGPLRFEFHTDADGVFDSLLRWKGAQLVATGQPNRLAIPWVVRLLDRIRSTRTGTFSGVVSALHIGDSLAAVHLGMRSPRVFHYWLPAYDPELAHLSPGLLCFLEIAKAAADLGVRRIDLGKGKEPYKQRLMSGSIPVAEGAIHVSPLAGAASRLRYRGLEWARTLPVGEALRAPARWVRRLVTSQG